jgi:hypothetical protein
MKFINALFLAASIALAFPAFAIELEITPMFGLTYSGDLQSVDGDEEIALSKDLNFALALAWPATPQGQGQLLINKVSHDFTSPIDDSKHSLDIISGYFSGVAQFKQPNYTTTVAIGVGGSHFKSDSDSVLYPSVTAALGTRYQVSKQLAIVTELRVFASLTKQDDDIFCHQETCAAQFNDSLWVDGSIMIGIAYRF